MPGKIPIKNETYKGLLGTGTFFAGAFLNQPLAKS